jgi:hypothetical protein
MYQGTHPMTGAGAASAGAGAGTLPFTGFGYEWMFILIAIFLVAGVALFTLRRRDAAKED